MQYISPNPEYTFETEENDLIKVKNIRNGFEFHIAKDSMGTQICKEGMFFPDARDFGSIFDAVKFLCIDNNLELAEKFFRVNYCNDAQNLFDIMMGLAFHNEFGGGDAI